MKSDFYYLLLDQYGKIGELAHRIKNLFFELKRLEAEKRKIFRDFKEYREKRDILEFQLNEIRMVNPIVGEDEKLEREINITENFEKIWELANQNFQILDGESDSVGEKLNMVLNYLNELISIDKSFEEVRKYIESALIEVRESAQFFSKYTDQNTYSPERLEETRMRQSQLYNLKRKYGKTISDILKRKETIENELKFTENIEERLKNIEIEIKEKLRIFSKLSKELSEKREKAAEEMSKSITELLHKLGMKSGLFSINVFRRESDDGIAEIDGKRYFADHYGIDGIEFLVATSKGEDLKPLARIASLGEISRVVLAVKSILAEGDEIPILIFDEIDVGISGRIASAVAKILKELSRYHQVICITHLPQIAGAGDTHLSAIKKEEKERVFTEIRKLNFEERKYEIAKLLGGEKITKISLKNAVELLKEGENF